jgi:hydroxymethylbilane synthase
MKSDRNHLIIGTRGSALALWQAEHIKTLLEKKFPKLTVELKIIHTQGDKILDAPLAKIGGKGVFTKELENALLRKEIDLAVHSLKDLPTTLPKGLSIGAITKREDVRDVFIARKGKKKKFSQLSEGAIIATGSLRRRAQLLHLRPDLEIVDIRGNLNTRVKKLDESKWDGMILAHAGVKRLGWEKRITDIFPAEMILPAVGQGALGIEIRTSDKETAAFIQKLHHSATASCALAERALLRTLEGGCQVPIGAHARITKSGLILSAIIVSLNGSILIRGEMQGAMKNAEALGKELAKRLYRNGGKEILKEIR